MLNTLGQQSVALGRAAKLVESLAVEADLRALHFDESPHYRRLILGKTTDGRVGETAVDAVLWLQIPLRGVGGKQNKSEDAPKDLLNEFPFELFLIDARNSTARFQFGPLESDGVGGTPLPVLEFSRLDHDPIEMAREYEPPSPPNGPEANRVVIRQ